MTGWGGATPLRGSSDPPRHDGVRQHPSSPGLRNNRGLELGLDPAGACAELRDDAARPTRAGALGGRSSCRIRLLTRACAFSAAPRHRRAAGLKSYGFKSYGFMASQMGNAPQTPIRGAARHLNEKSGPERSRRRRPRHATDAVSAQRGTCERQLMERMEKEGVVGPANHAGKREILLGSD